MNRIITALAAFCVLALSWAGPATAQNSAKQFKVTLLGTGTPPPFMHRFGPAILIQAGGRNLLFDSGRGVTQRLFQLKIPLGKIDHVFGYGSSPVIHRDLCFLNFGPVTSGVLSACFYFCCRGHQALPLARSEIRGRRPGAYASKSDGTY